MNFEKFFSTALGSSSPPFPYQSRLAGAEEDPADAVCATRLIVVPTGLGKTAAVILSWLWNRVHRQSDAWPRRLVYCLPMRTLAEQTYRAAEHWLIAHELQKSVGLYLLMGGEETDHWEQYPEENAILIGTQDMLLSRALNRGYGMSRFRWPMHFGMLHNDALWVFDEVQLMGAGLPTTAQLEAFRQIFGAEKPARTWWMSATHSPDWLQTVDFKAASLGPAITLGDDSDLQNETVIRLRQSSKPLRYCEHSTTALPKLAGDIIESTNNHPGLTLVVLNTVKKARDLHAEIHKQLHKSTGDKPPLILLHSQFRPADRERILTTLLASEGRCAIAISTQIIEAGVDLSAHTLYTEMAPWSSLVQRFGRCNRRGTDAAASIQIISADKPAPYQEDQLRQAKSLIDKLIADGKDASPLNLSAIPIPDCDKPAARHVIRRRDFIDLFDTTPDLAGNDIDIERWVRDAEDSKVHLFWRIWDGCAANHPPPDKAEFPPPHRRELCPAPIGEVRDWADKAKIPLRRWDHLSSSWELVPKEFGKSLLIPGHVYLVTAEAGAYLPETGFDPESSVAVTPAAETASAASESTSDDPVSRGTWQSIAVHTGHVIGELESMMAALGINLPTLIHAARWHDLGKAHATFVAKIDPAMAQSPTAATHLPHAKAPNEAWRKPNKDTAEARKHFRHELASALAVLQPIVTAIPDDERNLAAWLIATHHGKIRLSIRSLPEETPVDDPSKRFARGVWDGDPLPPVDLGAGITSPTITLSLEPMELGLCVEPPFENQPSWTERMLSLRDAPEIGPLRLAYWETLLRAADERASAKHP